MIGGILDPFLIETKQSHFQRNQSKFLITQALIYTGPLALYIIYILLNDKVLLLYSAATSIH